MITNEQATSLIGKPVLGQDGSKIGKVGQVFLDDQTGRPEWVTAQTGMFGTKESFVPLAQASVTADGLVVPYGKDKVTGAPGVDADAHLSQAEEAQLYSYYGLGYSEADSGSGLPTGTTTAQTTAPATAGTAARDGGDEAMTRSEERLRVGVQRVETGRARLRKHIVTEQVATTVPVEREQVRVVSEPITDANRDRAYAGVPLIEAEHEVVLHADRAVVEKEVVAVERIRLDTQTVTEQQQITEQVRSEQIELVDDKGTRTDVDSDPRH